MVTAGGKQEIEQSHTVEGRIKGSKPSSEVLTDRTGLSGKSGGMRCDYWVRSHRCA